MSRHRWRISHHRKHNGSKNANHFKSSKCHQYPGHQLQFPFHSPLAVTPPQLETVELPDHHWPPKRCCADSRNPAVGGFVWDQSKETGVGSRESRVSGYKLQSQDIRTLATPPAPTARMSQPPSWRSAAQTSEHIIVNWTQLPVTADKLKWKLRSSFGRRRRWWQRESLNDEKLIKEWRKTEYFLNIRHKYKFC